MKEAHPFVEAAFAAARKHLQDARTAQQNAVLFGMKRYKAGKLGRDARFMAHTWHQKRKLHLADALRVRKAIHHLRAELRRHELETQAA